MPAIQIKRGLDLPLPGGLESPEILFAPEAASVALLPADTPGIKVQMLVQEGDRVHLGQPLYCDRRDPQVVFGSPAAGTVEAVRRGARRAVLSVVVRVDDEGGQVEVPTLTAGSDRAAVVDALLRSGLWPCLRQRPFDRVAVSSETPRSLFITAMDSNPLAASPQALLQGREAHFRAGLELLAKLSSGATYVCTADGENWGDWLAGGAQQRSFRGPHPAGNVGVHIHHLDPVGAGRTVWHVGCQDVADIGEALSTGHIPTARLVAVTGPQARERSIVRTRRGAETGVFRNHIAGGGAVRVVSGSLLSGRTAQPGDDCGFLGRYASQVTMVADDPQRELLAWSMPIGRRWSLTNTYLAKYLKRGKLRVDTDLNGSVRAIVPIGSYEKVMPMDILATQLIKALASDDLEGAEKLGVLELGEEDLALCQYVCPSKIAITDLLRAMLTRIEKEG